MYAYLITTWLIQLVTIKQKQVKNREDQLTSSLLRIRVVHHQVVNAISSALSLLEDEQAKKKATMSTSTSDLTSVKEDQSSSPDSTSALKNIIEPLIEEMRKLRESVHQDIHELQTIVSNQQKDLTQLEECLTDSQNEIKSHLTTKVKHNTRNVKLVMEENKMLRKENNRLKDRISKIEQIQLENNIIISGQPEQPWETYDSTKERVFDMIAVTMTTMDTARARQEARKITITNCKRVGKYKMGRSRPISVTFPQKG